LTAALIIPIDLLGVRAIRCLTAVRAQCLANDVLPEIAQLLHSYWLDEKVNSAMGDAAKDDAGVPIG